MRRRSRLVRLAKALELPDDIVLDLPRITMLGNQQLLIENHRGIIEYTSSCIKINLNQGCLCVRGEKLTLGHLQKEQILIEGIVGELKYDT